MSQWFRYMLIKDCLFVGCLHVLRSIFRRTNFWLISPESELPSQISKRMVCACNFKSIVYIDAEMVAITRGRKKWKLSGSIFRVKHDTTAINIFFPTFLCIFFLIWTLFFFHGTERALYVSVCVVYTWWRQLIRQTANHYANLKWNGIDSSMCMCVCLYMIIKVFPFVMKHCLD